MQQPAGELGGWQACLREALPGRARVSMRATHLLSRLSRTPLLLQVVAAVLKSMQEEGRAAGLKGFEQVRNKPAVTRWLMCLSASAATALHALPLSAKQAMDQPSRQARVLLLPLPHSPFLSTTGGLRAPAPRALQC